MISSTATGHQFLNGNSDRPGESLLRQLKRVQSINYSFGITRQKVYQYGQLGCIDNVVVDAPDVSLDFTYLLTDGKNEHLLGLNNHDNSNLISSDLASDRDGYNFYVYTTNQRDDAVSVNQTPGTRISEMESQATGAKTVMAIGNCYLSSYSINASVGSVPTASVSVEGFNIKSDVHSGAFASPSRSPGIDVTGAVESTNDYKIPYEYVTSGDGIGAIRPGDIEVTVGDAGLFAGLGGTVNGNNAHIQSFSLDVPMSRSTLQRVGSSFGYSKVLDVPITASVSISALVADKPTAAQSLFTELYANNKSDLTISMKKPSSLGSSLGSKAIIFSMKDAVLESESYGMSIGDGRTVDLTFTASIANPAENRVSAEGARIQMQASGVYEQIQVFETGVSSDTSNHRKNDIGYGTAIAANNEILVIGASGFNLLGNDYEKGAAYIYKNKKGVYTQAQLVSGGSSEQHASVSNSTYLPEAGDTADTKFGFDVAVSPQNLIAIAQDGYGIAPTHHNTSVISIYHPNTDSTSWTIQDIMTGLKDGGTAGATILWGNSMAFDKELSGANQWFVAGAPFGDSGVYSEAGDVHVRYGTKGEVDSFVGYKLPKTSSEVVGGTLHADNERFGASVAMHKNAIVVGAPANSNSGVAYVYAADGTGPHTAATSWIEVAQLSGNSADIGSSTPALGTSVDIYDKTIVVGAPSGDVYQDSFEERGCVLVFTTSQDDQYRGWGYATKLTASDAQIQDRFGHSVSMPNRNTIVVGAPFEDDNATNAGSVYIFTGAGSSWTQAQKISYTGAGSSDSYGRYHSTLASTQKEIFFGGDGGAATRAEKVIRYRI